MRLIDTDKLLDALRTEPQYIIQEPRSRKSIMNMISNHHNKVIEVIEQQPTAYNVDKVVQELKNEKDIYTRNYNISPYKEFPEIKQRHECICIAIDKAIDIVRSGWNR